MKLAILHRQNDPDSLQIYYNNLFFELSGLGVEIIPFSENEPVPLDCILAWDPGMCMRPIPQNILNSTIPIIGTMHGVKAYSLPMCELVSNRKEELELIKCKNDLDQQWNNFKNNIAALITVSEYGKKEIINAIKINPDKVFTIYNGVNTTIFKKDGEYRNIGKPYFFHVSTVNPIKNFHRLLNAYSSLPITERPDLVAVIPNYKKKIYINGVHIIPHSISQKEIAEWYRGAVALILPSLRETFGLPIIEAMRCGTPVITSNSSGCVEISNKIGILIDPRDEEAIKHAMLEILIDCEKRIYLINKGLKYSKKFTWKNTAKEILNVIKKVCN